MFPLENAVVSVSFAHFIVFWAYFTMLNTVNMVKLMPKPIVK